MGTQPRPPPGDTQGLEPMANNTQCRYVTQRGGDGQVLCAKFLPQPLCSPSAPLPDPLILLAPQILHPDKDLHTVGIKISHRFTPGHPKRKQ